MFSAVKKIFNKNTDTLNSTSKIEIKSVNNKSLNNKSVSNSFGGMRKNQINHHINDKSDKNEKASSLVVSKVSMEAELKVKEVKDVLNKELPHIKQNPFHVPSEANILAEKISTIFLEGKTIEVIETLKNYINDNKGLVEHRFWYMLMDAYQIDNNHEGFLKVSKAFFNLFHIMPPAWKEKKSS